MKKKLFFILLASFPFILMACDKPKDKVSANKSENVAQQEGDEVVDGQKEIVGKETTADDKSDGSPIAEIREVWRDRTINSFNDDPSNTTPPIHQYVFSFCSEYCEFEPNQVLTRFIGSPRDFKKSPGDGSYQSDYPGLEFTYYITDHPRNGFISCSGAVQFDYRTECCYWKRNNGHHLVAFFMSEDFENPENNEHLLAFYDYDPTTSVMTPETELTDLVEERVEGYNIWTVSLPDKGKDVKISAYKEVDDDSVEELAFLMKWNGQTFRLESIDDYED